LRCWCSATTPNSDFDLLAAVGDRLVGVQDAMIQWWYGHNAVGFF